MRKRIKRVIKGVCTYCWGAGEVMTPKGKQVCTECDGKGEREIVFVEEVSE